MKKKIKELSEINSLKDHAYKVYSFDIFDTLISRCVPPEYVKILTSRYLANRYPEHLSSYTCLDIYNTRRQIELSLEEENVRQGHDRDYQFHDCIRLLVEKLFGNRNPEIQNDIASFEISLEIAVASVNKDAVSLLTSLKDRGRRIICISDMYLGGTIVSEILKAKGLLQYIDAIYVSSDLKKRKDTGNIFPLVIREEAVQPSEILHLGDNELTDFAIPERYGIRAVHFSSQSQHRRYEMLNRILTDGTTYRTSPGFLVRALISDHEFSGSVTHNRMSGTLAYPFIAYIHALIDFCKERNITKVYFLSREGLFFKNIFTIIDDQRKSGIQAEYLYVSRKSLIVPSIPDLTPENIEILLNYYEHHYFKPKASISQILNMLMIDNVETRKICMEYTIHPETLLNIKISREVIREVLSDADIKKIYSARHHEYKKTFLKYLAYLGIPEKGSFVFSDMGWSGSMQTYLQEFLDRNNYEIEIYGYYFGFDETVDKKKHRQDNFNRKKGYFHYSDNPDHSDARVHYILNNITLELIATAPHGTVLAYRDMIDKIEPVCADNREEIRQYNNFSKKIQEYVLQFAQNYNPLLAMIKNIYAGKEIYEYVLNECYDFFANPDMKSAQTVSTLVMIDDFFGDKQTLKFRTTTWWPAASNLLRENRCIVKHLFHKIKTTALKDYISELKMKMFYGSAYGFKDYIKITFHDKIGKFYLNDRKLKLIKTYHFKKDPCRNSPFLSGYIFFSSFNPRSKKKYNALVKNLARQKLERVLAIVRYRGKYSLFTIDQGTRVHVEKISRDRVMELISANNFMITISDDVLIDEGFLCRMNEKLTASHADALYCDNDTQYRNICYTNPKFKQGWSKYSYFEYDYIGPVIAVRTARATEHLDRFMLSYEKWGARGAMLSVLENLQTIDHLPAVLYHDHKYDRESSCKPVNDYFTRNGMHAHAEQKKRHLSRITFSGIEEKLISIIIPFKDKSDYLKTCVDSILKKTEYPNYEIMLVNNNSAEEKTGAYLRSLGNDKRIQIIDYNSVFNYSALNNYAVDRCRGEYIVFLNNDTEILHADWLNRMLDYAHLPGVGCVGAKLVYPDGRIQHGGIIFNFNYEYPATNQFSFESKHSRGYLNRLVTVQNYSAVAAACMMMRKEVFYNIGGFDESFMVAYNDLDLCCKLIREGYEIIWNPHVEVIHYEYVSRGNPMSSETDKKERDMFIERWKDMFKLGDPHHTPSLDLFGNLLD